MKKVIVLVILGIALITTGLILEIHNNKTSCKVGVTYGNN